MFDKTKMPCQHSRPLQMAQVGSFHQPVIPGFAKEETSVQLGSGSDMGSNVWYAVRLLPDMVFQDRRRNLDNAVAGHFRKNNRNS
jgi:hypothetical protein